MTRDRSRHARTTSEAREAVREIQGNHPEITERLGINRQTVAKWCSSAAADSTRVGARTSLSRRDEAVAIAFRLYARLPLGDCLTALRLLVPHLSRSTLHRCFQRYGIERLAVRKASAGRAEANPVGNYVVGRSQLLYRGRSIRCFVAVDHASKFIYADLLEAEESSADRMFLDGLTAASPCPVMSIRAVSEALPCNGHRKSGPQEEQHLSSSASAMSAALSCLGDALLQAEESGAELDLAHFRSRFAEIFQIYNECCALSFLNGLTPAAYSALHSPERWSCHGGPAEVPAADADPRSGLLPAQAESVAVALSEKPKPQSARAAQTRKAILEAAGVRLAYDGPEGLSLSEVARAAGVNRRTAYHHFQTRENLVKEAEKYVSEQMYRAIFGNPETVHDRPVRDIDPVDVAMRLAHFAMNNPELCRGWLLRVLSSADPAEDMFWREYQGSAARFANTDLAQVGIDTEVMSVIMLAGAFLWPVWARAKAHEEHSLQTHAERFARESIRLSMYGNLQGQRYPDIETWLRATRA